MFDYEIELGEAAVFCKIYDNLDKIIISPIKENIGIYKVTINFYNKNPRYKIYIQ